MRLLKTFVIVMGVVLVLGFAALIFIVVTRINAPKPEKAQTTSAPPPPAPQPAPAPIALPPLGATLPPQFTPNFGEQAIAIPAGARLSDFSAGGERLVLRLILEDQSQQLMVVDLNTGALIGTLRLEVGGEAASVPPLPMLPGVDVPPRNRQEGGK